MIYVADRRKNTPNSETSQSTLLLSDLLLFYYSQLISGMNIALGLYAYSTMFSCSTREKQEYTKRSNFIRQWVSEALQIASLFDIHLFEVEQRFSTVFLREVFARCTTSILQVVVAVGISNHMRIGS
ncbi:hypothetical protein BDF20DRAFT_855655 [Mycotypha africana]|uniref:uncharacterized protein n=1 Tax=Mycotypha africana TaxID=64632 RepID=UPI002300491E|nr:uncharacterized protein BDF20DRAFT_855655 [Mycotypha africana]KAI8988432.1 hypothetical protein BDF20DRAFT_855655 [Mycotypha africana]